MAYGFNRTSTPPSPFSFQTPGQAPPPPANPPQGQVPNTPAAVRAARNAGVLARLQNAGSSAGQAHLSSPLLDDIAKAVLESRRMPQGMAFMLKRQQINKLRNQYLEAFPGIDSEKLQDAALAANKRGDAAWKLELIGNSRPGLSAEKLGSMSELEIDGLFETCELEQRIVTRSGSMLAQVDKQSQAQAGVNFKVALTRVDDNHVEFKLPDNDIGSGYGLFNLIHALGLVAETDRFGSVDISPDGVGKYDNRTSFVLSLAEMEKLNTALEDIIEWKDKNATALMELFDVSEENIAENVQIGQKPMSEIAKRQGALTPEAQRAFSNNPTPVLILTTASLNLANLPHRDAIRAEIQDLYKYYNLLDSNGNPKTFIIEEPYRSNLSVAQLACISPAIQEMLQAKRAMDTDPMLGGMDMFWSEDLALNLGKSRTQWAGENRVQRMLQECRSISGGSVGNLEEIAQMLVDSSNFGVMTDVAKAIHFSMMNVFAVMTRISSEETPDLSDAQRASLYRTEDRLSFLSFARQPAVLASNHTPDTSVQTMVKQVRDLFVCLRKSEAFRDLSTRWTDLGANVNALEREFMGRLEGGGGAVESYMQSAEGGFYGRKMVREAVAALETLVGKIQFSGDLNVGKENIEMAFAKLVGHTGDEMHDHCATGFARRVNDMNLSLISDSDELVTSDLREFVRQGIEAAFADAYSGRGMNESSMCIPQKTALMKSLGVLGHQANETVPTLADVPTITNYQGAGLNFLRQAMQHHLKPGIIFDRVHELVSDRFWKLASSGDDEGVRKLLKEFGFDPGQGEEHEQFIDYRMGRDATQPWQYAYFQRDLREKLLDWMRNTGMISDTPNVLSGYSEIPRVPEYVDGEVQPHPDMQYEFWPETRNTWSEPPRARQRPRRETPRPQAQSTPPRPQQSSSSQMAQSIGMAGVKLPEPGAKKVT